MNAPFLSFLYIFINVLVVSASHSNNWALLVGASRYWFNYRHIANTLSIYHTIKSLGIPDSQIILMLADDMGCNPRNSYAGQIFNNPNHQLNLYDEDIEVDYRGTDATVENFLRLLTGRHSPETPHSKRLLTDRNSNLLIYMTGHGGDEFLKFQDSEELTSKDLADALYQMHVQQRYNEIFFVADTCQASTLHKQFYAPNILSVGSAKLGQNSYSYVNDDDVGISLVDRFTNYALEYFQTRMRKRSTIGDWLRSIPTAQIMSEPEWRTDLFNRSIDKARISDFFGSVNPIQPIASNYPIQLDNSPVISGNGSSSITEQSVVAQDISVAPEVCFVSEN